MEIIRERKATKSWRQIGFDEKRALRIIQFNNQLIFILAETRHNRIANNFIIELSAQLSQEIIIVVHNYKVIASPSYAKAIESGISLLTA